MISCNQHCFIIPNGVIQMEQVKASIEQAIQYLSLIRVSDIVDILLVAFIIYEVIKLVRKTNTKRVAKGVLLIVLALWISEWLSLTVTNYLLSKFVEIGLLAIVIIFQPELRRALERVGSGNLLGFLRGDANVGSTEQAITQVVIACDSMSQEHTGALIVFERNYKLDNQINTGTVVHADVSAELIKNLFFEKAALHDGAIIIGEGKIIAAGCMLPLSNNTNLSRDLGMRHRAGIGMSEHSDAVVVIVSEETGAISVAIDGTLKRHLDTDTFEKILRSELLADDTGADKKKKHTLFGKRKRNNDGQETK